MGTFPDYTVWSVNPLEKTCMEELLFPYWSTSQMSQRHRGSNKKIKKNMLFFFCQNLVKHAICNIGHRTALYMRDMR